MREGYVVIDGIAEPLPDPDLTPAQVVQGVKDKPTEVGNEARLRL